MESRVQRLLRPVWLINGILLLALLALGVVIVAGAWIVDLTAGDSAVSVAPPRKEEETAQAVRFDAPATIRGTDARIVLIRRGEEGRRSGSFSSSYEGGETGGPMVNVGFLTGGGTRLLLDRRAYVSAVRWPGGVDAGGVPRDSLLRWVVYEMAADDDNGDGRLDHRDERTLYLSALDGTGLRRALPAGFRLRGWEVREDGSLYVSTLALPAGDRRDVEEERLPQRAFLVGADGQARSYAALDSLATAAARVLGK